MKFKDDYVKNLTAEEGACPAEDRAECAEESARPTEEQADCVEESVYTIFNQSGYVEEPAVAYDVVRKKQQGEYTIQDYYNLPDDQRAELIDGVIYYMSAPTSVHQMITGKMYLLVSDYIQKKGGRCIPFMSPVDVRLDQDDKTMVQPDLIIVCDKDQIRRWGIMGSPDFGLEVLSESTRKKDCTKKVQKYEAAGVKEYWIIDPKLRQLLVYDFRNGRFPLTYALNQKVGIALYNGDLEIDLKEVDELIRDWPD